MSPAARLFAALWRRYRAQVPYARAVEAVQRRLGGGFRNDHVAFRTFAAQEPGTGIQTVGRVFEALGYSAAGCYAFPDKHLRSLHYQHPDRTLPKVFVSELRTWELSPAGRAAVRRTLASHRRPLPDALLARPSLPPLLRFFTALPWAPPRESDVLALERESQFAAWVAVHGYAVNHFTAATDDIAASVAALRARGVPMKAAIEGAPGSKLRQSSTAAAVLPVRMRAGSRLVRRPWTYAYVELAERRGGFGGFLGGQAAQLFEMTKRR